MPKHAERVWPYEDGMQGRAFWQREEDFANQHVRTSIAREVAMSETIADIEQHAEDELIQIIIRGYHARLNEIYTAHRKAIRSIKEMYPSIR